MEHQTTVRNGRTGERVDLRMIVFRDPEVGPVLRLSTRGSRVRAFRSLGTSGWVVSEEGREGATYHVEKLMEQGLQLDPESFGEVMAAWSEMAEFYRDEIERAEGAAASPLATPPTGDSPQAPEAPEGTRANLGAPASQGRPEPRPRKDLDG